MLQVRPFGTQDVSWGVLNEDADDWSNATVSVGLSVAYEVEPTVFDASATVSFTNVVTSGVTYRNARITLSVDNDTAKGVHYAWARIQYGDQDFVLLLGKFEVL